MIKWLLILLISCCHCFSCVFYLIIILIFSLFILVNLLLHWLYWSRISYTLFTKFNEILLSLVLTFNTSFFAMMQSYFSSQKLSPILVKLFDSIKCENNIIFFLYSLIFSPQWNKLYLYLELFKNSWFKLFSNFKFVTNWFTYTFFIVYF